MCHLIVRNLEDDVRYRLEQLAAAHGRSMEEEVRAILRAAVLQAELRSEDGLGTRIATRFREHGVGPGEIVEHKRYAPRPADLWP
ncbi:MAG: hypothetical protein AAGA20_04615 [Planctomycetota bacterium]